MIKRLVDFFKEYCKKHLITIGLYAVSTLYFFLLSGKVVFSLIFGCISFITIPFFKKSMVLKRRDNMILEFHDFIYLFDSNLKSGKSIDNALVESRLNLFSIYGEDTDLGRELERVIYLNKIGVGYEKGFLMLEDSYSIGFFKDLANVIEIVKYRGGNINEILENTSNTICERLEIEREISTLLSKQRLEVIILRVLPFIFLIIIRLLYPDMIEFLVSSIIGIVCLIVVGFLFYLAFHISNKLMEVTWE